jgi:hypothetical protein
MRFGPFAIGGTRLFSRDTSSPADASPALAHTFQLDSRSPSGSDIYRCTRCQTPFVYNATAHRGLTVDEAAVQATLPACIQDGAP